jgi:hypothetical protein
MNQIQEITFQALFAGSIPATGIEGMVKARLIECHSEERILETRISHLEASMVKFDENYFDHADKRDNLLNNLGMVRAKINELLMLKSL